MRFVPWIFVVLTLASVAALAADDYVPVNLGQERTMAVRLTTPAGTVSDGTEHRNLETSVDKEGRTYVRCHIWTEGLRGNVDYTKLYRKDENGVYAIDERGNDSREQAEFVFPLKEGATWQQAANGRTYTNTVIGIEMVEIEGKRYAHCFHIHIDSDDKSVSIDFWLADGIGSIKAQSVRSDGSRFTYSLKAFKPGK